MRTAQSLGATHADRIVCFAIMILIRELSTHNGQSDPDAGSCSRPDSSGDDDAGNEGRAANGMPSQEFRIQ